jgi:hypothetical protein
MLSSGQRDPGERGAELRRVRVLGGVLVATPAPKIVAATATASMPSTSSGCEIIRIMRDQDDFDNGEKNRYQDEISESTPRTDRP